MNVEAFLVRRLGEALGVPVYADVPETRPKEFVTVELTAARADRFIERPTVAVQSWAGTRLEAAELAQLVDDAMLCSVVDGECPVTQVSRQSLYNYPSPDGVPRYQGVYDLVNHR